MARWKSRAVKPERIGAQPQPRYDDDAKKMTAYHKRLILALAERYKGKELEKRLRELKFCSYETAREVIDADENINRL